MDTYIAFSFKTIWAKAGTEKRYSLAGFCYLFSQRKEIRGNLRRVFVRGTRRARICYCNFCLRLNRAPYSAELFKLLFPPWHRGTCLKSGRAVLVASAQTQMRGTFGTSSVKEKGKDPSEQWCSRTPSTSFQWRWGGESYGSFLKIQNSQITYLQRGMK